MQLLLTTPALNVYQHMALDETLVHRYPGGCVLRFYEWTSVPAVTFGYAQLVNQVRRGLQQRSFAGDICRRPTGGGVVYHTDDLTFSLIFPSTQRPSEIYKQLHGAIRAALVLSGFSSALFAQKSAAQAYAPSQNNQANACFTNPVENDLLQADGQKMLGGAIRRFKDTVLYQGSLQTPGARYNPAYKHALIQAVRSFLNTDLQIERAPEAVLQAANRLAQTQYNTLAWMEKF
jgi:lipoate-protein ligase A